MRNQPSLQGLVNSDTVLVLGAGASKDYGFPDWSGLKHQLSTLIRTEAPPDNRTVFSEVPVSEATEHDFHALADEIDSLQNTETLDQFVEGRQISGSRFLGPVFRQGVGTILRQCEAADVASGTTAWIESLFKELAPIAQKANKFGLKVITLNYERCFEYHAQHAIEAARLGNGYRADFSYLPNVRVVHPHGILGYFPNTSTFTPVATIETPTVPLNRQIAYGESLGSGYRYPIFPIDTVIEMGMKRGYDSANADLMSSESAVLLGLSPIGLGNSSLTFPANQRVWVAGSEREFCTYEAAKGKLPPNTTFVGGYGPGIIDKLKTA